MNFRTRPSLYVSIALASQRMARSELEKELAKANEDFSRWEGDGGPEGPSYEAKQMGFDCVMIELTNRKEKAL